MPWARSLHPGLPGLDGATSWRPSTYPFSPAEARVILNDLRSLRPEELDAMRALHNSGSLAEDADLRRELAHLERLGAPGAIAEDHISGRQAQKILLWIWAQEETLAEIAGLENSCAVSEFDLEQVFKEEKAARVSSPVAPDLSLLPPWRPCAANAAFFIPPEMPILVEGAMASEMREFLDFTPTDAWDPMATGHKIEAARAPLWKVLGQKRSRGLEPFHTAERVWLALEDE